MEHILSPQGLVNLHRETSAFFGTKPVDFGVKAVYFVAAHAAER